MAVPLNVVRASNAQLKELKPGLVGVFVGGTSGIGEATLKAFAKHTISPKIYIVGRNEAAANTIIEEVKKVNTESSVSFVKSDTSLLQNVDNACKEIQAKENEVNVLFLSTGYLALAGREETSEGFDQRLSLNYYSRWRFVQNLLPQLTAASKDQNSLSRVVSVLAAGQEGKIVEDDLDLKKNFSLRFLGAHAVAMNDFACEEMAKQYPDTAFVHMFPGIVKTGIMNNGGTLLKITGMLVPILLRPILVSNEESGERNLYHATAKAFAPKNAVSDVSATGSDGTKGTGGYLLHWNGKPVGSSKILGPLRAKGMGPKIWEHTLEMFKKVEEKGN